MRHKIATLATVALLAGLLPATSVGPVVAQEGSEPPQEEFDARLVPLQETGPPAERLNLILLGDGYTAEELDKFHEDVDRNQNVQWSVEPFRSYRNYFNVYALEIVSGVSGIRCDPDDPPGGDPGRITPLRLHYSDGCTNPLARGTTYGPSPQSGPCPGVIGHPQCSGSQQRNMYLQQYVEPELGIPWNAQNVQTLAIFNSFTYGGIGGVHATTSGGSPQGPLISLHELGHSLGNLQDEYPYSARDVPGPVWPNTEPSSIHHTRMSSEEMLENEAKWWRWLGEESESGGIIRAADPDGYESGQYRCCNIWRPSEHSMMRWIGFYFDQIGREHMTQRITGLRNANEMPVNAVGDDQETENLAPAAAVTCSYTSPWENCSAINSGNDPASSNSSPRWGTWPEGGSHWVELTWDEPQTISVSDMYWFQDSADGSNSGVKRAATWSLQYWDGDGWAHVENPSGYGDALDEYNRTTFDPVTTTRLRANVETRDDALGVGIMEWRIFAEEPLVHPEVGPDDVVWVETMHPRFHELDVTWEINDEVVPDTHNTRNLELAELDVEPGDVVRATVHDPTEFVRDPFYQEGPRMTQVREWVVGTPLAEADVEPEITLHSPTERALARDEVAYVETTHPTGRVLDVTWRVDGEELPNPHNSRNLPLGDLDLAPGSYELSATATDPEDPDGASDTVTWTVDNNLPSAPRELSEPVTALPGDLDHNVYFGGFDMWLDPQDAHPGYVVGELRLNGRGWYNYFGFPEEPFGSPFRFRHSGTDVKALTYGNLGSGGLSKATFEQYYTEDDPNGPFEPGYDTHTVEHRAIDVAGNIGDAEEFRATVLPGGSPACTDTVTGQHRGRLNVRDGVTCVAEGATVSGGVSVGPGASLVVADGATINGGLQTRDADVVHVFGTRINGDSAIAGTADDVVVAGSDIRGSLSVEDNDALVVEILSGDTRVYGIALVGNSVTEDLVCSGNDPGVTDFGASNAVGGSKAGQCADL